MPHLPNHLDLSSFRSYLATRRHYTEQAIDLRQMLRTAPPEALTAPELLAWMPTSGQSPEMIVYVSAARSAYNDACRAAHRRAKDRAL